MGPGPPLRIQGKMLAGLVGPKASTRPAWGRLKAAGAPSTGAQLRPGLVHRYVIDEANIESHGMGFDAAKTLAAHEGFHDAHLERISRMVERDKNFACVIVQVTDSATTIFIAAPP